MFEEITAELTGLRNRVDESVHDKFGLSIVTDILEPIIQETNSLVSMHDEMERELGDLERMAETVTSLRQRQ